MAAVRHGDDVPGAVGRTDGALIPLPVGPQHPAWAPRRGHRRRRRRRGWWCCRRLQEPPAGVRDFVKLRRDPTNEPAARETAAKTSGCRVQADSKLAVTCCVRELRGLIPELRLRPKMLSKGPSVELAAVIDEELQHARDRFRPFPHCTNPCAALPRNQFCRAPESIHESVLESICLTRTDSHSEFVQIQASYEGLMLRAREPRTAGELRGAGMPGR